MNNNFKRHYSDIEDVYDKLEKLKINNKSFKGINFNAPTLIPRAHPTNETPTRIYFPDNDNEQNPNPIPEKIY
jgi:hypothetical protein